MIQHKCISTSSKHQKLITYRFITTTQRTVHYGVTKTDTGDLGITFLWTWLRKYRLGKTERMRMSKRNREAWD